MDRKKTILVAVLINAGLLVVLFIAALTTQEETLPEFASLQEATPQPLFAEPINLSEKPPSIAIPFAIQEAPIETPSVSLPPLAQEPVIPSAFVQTPSPAAPPVQHAAVDVKQSLEVTVKKGDSLEKIAKVHQMSVDELIKLNQLSSTFLRIGQVLKVRADKAAQAPVSKPKAVSNENGTEFYTVKVGDNPWTIAMKHHMKVDELLKLNGLNEERARKLKPGDRLRIR